MSHDKSAEVVLLNEEEFKDGLFELGYDRAFGKQVFRTLVGNVAGALEPTQEVSRLTSPFSSTLFADNPRLRAIAENAHNRTYTRTYQVRVRSEDSIAYFEENRDGDFENNLCLTNLAVIAEDIRDVTGMGPKKTQATFALLDTYGLLPEDAQ